MGHHWRGTGAALADGAVAEYQRCFDAAAIRATNEEFRAAATIDLMHDVADQDSKISCPMLLLWSKDSWTTFDILEVWRSRAENVQGVALDCGHFLAEENSERTAEELMRFYRNAPQNESANASVPCCLFPWFQPARKKLVTKNNQHGKEGEHLFGHGRLSYVQIPAVDVDESARFYEEVFGWQVHGRRTDHVSFTDATGDMIGAWITGLTPSQEPGVLPYIYVHGVDAIMQRITANGGQVVRAPYPEGDLWVATFRDPAGNVIGIWQQGQR